MISWYPSALICELWLIEGGIAVEQHTPCFIGWKWRVYSIPVSMGQFWNIFQGIILPLALDPQKLALSDDEQCASKNNAKTSESECIRVLNEVGDYGDFFL